MKTIWDKTCFIIDTLEIGGTQNQLLLIARYLHLNHLPAFHLIVFCEPLTLLDEFKKFGVKVIHIEKRKKIDFIFLYNLYTCLKKIKPAVVVTFLITADMWGRLIALLAGVPKVGCSVRSMPQRLGFIKDTFLRLMNKFCDFVVCNSFMGAKMTIKHNKLDQKKVSVIYNGISADSFATTSFNTDMFTIGTVARLIPLKSITTLLRSFARIQSKYCIRLIIVGSGPSKGALENEATSLGISDKTCFMGERFDVKDIIKSFDICVLTSQYEGLSNVIMEYMQAGKPVLATCVGGNSELVDDGVTGYLFRYGDVDQLARLLEFLISSPDIMSEMGIAGRAKIIKNFSIETMVAKWENILS